MIEVRRIRDAFHRPHLVDATEVLSWRSGLRLGACEPHDLGNHIAILNHKAVRAAEDPEIADGSEIVFAEVPGIFAAIFPALLPVVAGILDVIAVSAVSIGLSYGIAALTAPKLGLNKAFGNQEDGPARNWEGIQDTAGNGRPIPFVYGKVRTGGQFLQSFERLVTGEEVKDGITTLHTLLGIGVGPLESIEDLEINGNPIGTIPDVDTQIRLGEPDQAPFDGFGEIAREILYQRPILKVDDWQTYITTDEVDAIEVIFRFPGGLLRSSSTGNALVNDVRFQIQIRQSGTGNLLLIASATKTISAKSRNPVKGSIRFDGLSRGNYEIKILRETLDDGARPAGLTYQSASEVYAITELLNESSAHPGVAMVALRQLPSEQLNASVPTSYTFLVRGFRDIRIYVDDLSYTTGWTDNNSWCLAHFITTPNHGLGDKYDWSDIDLPAFLDFAAYCDEMVDDTKGGLEKRSTFNHVFDSVISAEEALQTFVQGAGANLIKRGSKWTIVIDRTDEMIWVGTEGNIAPGTLRLSFLPAASIANRIQVAFVNQDDNYQRDSDHDEIPALPEGTPYVDASRSLWGVTRPTQVARELKRLLLHNKLASTQIELESGLDSLCVGAGSIFGVAMKTIGIGIASGRILRVDATGTLITIDEEVTIEAGKTYEVVVHHASGDRISTKAVNNAPGLTEDILAADADWSSPIAAGDIYSLGEVQSAIEKFRCVECSLDVNFRRKIRGLKYDPNVYTFNLEALPTDIKNSIPDPRQFPPPATDLFLHERQEFSTDGSMVDLIDADWTMPVSAILDHFEVWLRPSDGAGWELQGQTSTGHFTIRGIASGITYVISVVSVSAAGMKGPTSEGLLAAIATAGYLVQPSNLTNLQAWITDGTLIATVDPAPEGQLGPSGFYEWRRGTSWNQSLLLDTTKSPRIEIHSYSRGITNIMVKAVNSGGNKSPIAASTSLALYGQIEENIVLTAAEDPSWAGKRIGFRIESGLLTLLEPSSSATYRRMRRPRRREPRLHGFGAPAPRPKVIPEGLYTGAILTVSSGPIVTARADVQINYDSIFVGLGTFSEADFAFGSPEAEVPFSGNDAGKFILRIESRVSTTDTAEGSFSPWADHRERGEIAMKYIQFRLYAKTEDPSYAPNISAMRVSIDLPDKVSSGKVTIASANPVSVTYPSSYFVAVKRLLATLIGGANGDYLKTYSETATGFTAEIRNSSNALIAGTVHYEARGY